VPPSSSEDSSADLYKKAELQTTSETAGDIPLPGGFFTDKVLKLVTVERADANGPWRYGLPEELSKANSRFRSLPTPQALRNRRRPGVSGARDR
jgi:hypothetical protein